MELKGQCCSVEQAKKLKELGVIQDSLFYHFPNPNTDEIKKKNKLPDYNIRLGHEYLPNQINCIKTMVLTEGFQNTFSAFTVAELGIMLPEYYPSWRFKINSKIKWITTVITKNKIKDGKTITTINEFDRYELTEAQARASLLIDLLINSVIKIKHVNNRLIK